MLHINNLTYRIAGRMLLDNATAYLPAGHRVGLVGRNGMGKSTLLRLIVGDTPIDGGSISLQPNARMGYLRQDVTDPAASALDTVLAMDTERAALLAESETATEPNRIADIHTRLADIGAHAAPARAGRILDGLGFDREAQNRPLQEFSGGWRMRVALAGVLFQEPDLLLLDEPTNHLDLEATIWLQDYIARYPHTVVIVSHDRDLLNTAVSHILHLDDRRLTLYGGGYDTFEKTRREHLTRQAKMHARQELERKRLQAFVDRFKAKASKAKQAQSRVKMLEKMEPIAAVMDDQIPTFDFPKPDILPPPLITVEHGKLGYDDTTPILSKLDIRLDSDDRVALLGANGNGKSTLAKWLAQTLKIQEGRERRSNKLKVGYFAQHQLEQLKPEMTVLDQMQHLMEDATEAKVRAHVARFGFGEERINTKISNLSGGEKARLVFAIIAREAPHLLVLDEPTNHLDIDSRQALIQALNAYDGAVVLVSHDTHIVELVADRLYLVADGTVARYDGTMSEYRQMLIQQSRGTKSDTTDTDTADIKKQKRVENAQSRAALAPLKKKVQSTEKLMADITQKISVFDKALSDPALYTEDPKKAADFSRAKADLEKKLAQAEEDWLTAQEALEAAV